MRPQFSAGGEARCGVEVDRVTDEMADPISGFAAARRAGIDVRDQPPGLIGRIIGEEFHIRRRTRSREVERVTNEDLEMLPGVRRAPAEISDLPCGTVAVGRDASPCAGATRRTGVVLEGDVRHGLANEEVGPLDTRRERTGRCAGGGHGSDLILLNGPPGVRRAKISGLDHHHHEECQRHRSCALTCKLRIHGCSSTPQVPTSYALS